MYTLGRSSSEISTCLHLHPWLQTRFPTISRERHYYRKSKLRELADMLVATEDSSLIWIVSHVSAVFHDPTANSDLGGSSSILLERSRRVKSLSPFPAITVLRSVALGRVVSRWIHVSGQSSAKHQIHDTALCNITNARRRYCLKAVGVAAE
jgi:hypothetical protein